MCVRPGPGWARTRAASMNRVIYSGVMVGVGRQLLGPKLSSRESRATSRKSAARTTRYKLFGTPDALASS